MWQFFSEPKLKSTSMFNKKAELSQRRPRDAPYIWVPWQFSRVPQYAHGYFSRNFNGLLFRSTLWMCTQNLKVVALPVSEIIEGTQKIWAVPWIRPRSLRSKLFHGLFRMDPLNVPENLKSVALPVPEIIAIEVLGGGWKPSILGKRRP